MKKEDIKSLEDAMKYIDAIEKSGQDTKTQIDGLTSKVATLEESNQKLTTENGDLKQKYYDLWISKPMESLDKNKTENEEPTKSLDELLLEE